MEWNIARTRSRQRDVVLTVQSFKIRTQGSEPRRDPLSFVRSTF